MMNDNELRERLHHAMDTRLSGMTGDPWLAGRVVAEAEGEKKVKRKVSLGLIVALVLLLAAVGALAVGALTGLFRLEQSDVGAMRGCVSTGDALYLMSSGGLCRWTPEDEEPTTLISSEEMGELGLSFEALPYLDDEGLALMDTEGKKIWRYRDGEVSLTFDYAGAPMDFPELRCQSAVYQDGWLFLLAASSEKQGFDTFLYRINPLTGDVEQMPVPAPTIKELCAYEPGKLLVLGSNGHNESIFVLDTDTGDVLKALYTAPIQRVRGLAYQKEYGGLYALVGGVLSRWNGTDWTELNGSAQGFLANFFAVVKEGYVSVSFDEMQYLPFSSDKSLTSLKIRGPISGDNTDADFQKAFGTAVVRDTDPALTAGDVRKAIEAGDTTDLFYVKLDADLLQMVYDGFAAPLTSSKMLAADARAVMPLIRETLFHDGQLYAVPSIMSPMVWEGKRALPETYGEVLNGVSDEDLSIAWRFSQDPWTKEDHMNYLLETFIAESTRNGGTVDFHEEAFENALVALKTMGFSGLSDLDTSILGRLWT